MLTEDCYYVTLLNKGSIYAQICLKDVNGLDLRDPDGKPLTLYSRYLKNAIARGDIKVHHCLSPGYRYFTTHHLDHKLFLEDILNGADVPYREYTVYFDDDFDLRCGRRAHRYVNWRLPATGNTNPRSQTGPGSNSR